MAKFWRKAIGVFPTELLGADWALPSHGLAVQDSPGLGVALHPVTNSQFPRISCFCLFQRILTETFGNYDHISKTEKEQPNVMLKASVGCLGSNPGSVTKQQYDPGQGTSLSCASVPRTRWLHWRILPNKNKLTSIFLKLILKIAEVEMFSHSFCVASITLIPKSNKHIIRKLQTNIPYKH